MLQNFIKVAWRNLFRQFGYTILNVLGLAAGLAASIFIFLYVFNELSYDRFHEKADRIYRIGVKGRMPGNELNQVVTAAPMMTALLNDYPEVEEACRLGKFGGWLVQTGDKKFQETDDDFIFADSTFFDVFSFRVLEGDPKTALIKPRSIVLTENYARKYFGDADPLGKTFKIEKDTAFYEVTGVMENIPVNSHFHFNMVGSLSSLGNSRSDNWVNHNFFTYVVLAPGTDVEKFTDGLREMVIKYVGPTIERFIGVGLDEFEKAGNSFGYFTQPLTDIHLHSNLQAEYEVNGNLAYVYIFLIIAVLILVMASINFMNLATARATTRAREVGLRKVVGSNKSLLISQFLAESIIMSLLSLVIAVVIVYLALPAFDNMIRLKLDFSIFRHYTLPLLILLSVLVGIMGGTYPAFVLASFRPASVLKSEPQSASGKGFLRALLVVVQFTVVIVILLGTVLVTRQLRYMQDKELGFQKKNMLVIRRSDALGDKIDAFKEEIRHHANVIDAANSTHIPSTPFWNNAHWLEGQGFNNTLLLNTCYVSYDFGKTMGLELFEGRFFDREMGTDSSGVVINESAVKTLAIEDPLKQRFIEPNSEGEGEVRYLPIIGIVKDFHYESMHEDIHPMAMHFMQGNYEGYIIVRLGSGNIPETVNFIRQKWEEFDNEYPFEYTWMDDEFDKLFDPERRTSRILAVFSILSIIISCLGLLGLISFSTVQRTKEIGIRKTLGARVGSIVVLLSRETVILMGIATILSFPAYFGIRSWFRNFAYHIAFSPVRYIILLVVLAIIILLIALMTVSLQSYRAAAANPARSLRVE